MKLAVKKWKAAPAVSTEQVEKVIREDEVLQAFTKEKLITYAAFLFLPPYGLYRIWKKNSSFRKAERYVWTMMFAAYMACLIQAIVL